MSLINDKLELSEMNKASSFLRDIIKSALLGILLAFFISRIIYPVMTVGYSMEPTLFDGEYVLVNKLDKKPDNGDIVILDFGISSKDHLVKRVIAIQGDNLLIDKGKVFINGIKLEEPYVKVEWEDGSYSSVIPDGYIYVMGDNRNESFDSRQFGLVKIDDIVGKVLFK